MSDIGTPTSLTTPISSLFGVGPTDLAGLAPLPPLTPYLPQYRRTLTRQQSPTSDVGEVLGQVSPRVAQAYIDLQTHRVNDLGQAPYTTAEAKAALTAADTRAPTTTPPTPNILQGFTRDVDTLVHTIPKLPVALAHETTQLAQAPGKIAEGLARARNPLEALGNVAAAPGVRLVPGSFIASQFGSDQAGVSGLLEHPLFTALDVLPYASKAASASKTVSAAQEAARAQANIAAEAGLAPRSTRTPPIKTFLRNVKAGGPEVGEQVIGHQLDDAGLPTIPVTAPALTPNLYGKTLATAKDLFASTRAGQTLSSAFGGEARGLVRSYNRASADIATARVSPTSTPLESAAIHARDLSDDLMVKSNLTTQERADAWVAMSTGDTVLQSALPPHVQEAVTQVRTGTESLLQARLDAGDLTRFRNEIYDTPTGNRLTTAHDRAVGAATQILDHYHGRGQYATDEATIPRVADYQANPDLQLTLQRLQSSLDAGDWQAARTDLHTLRSTARFDPLPYTQARANLQFLDNLEARSTPARFGEVIQGAISSRIVDMIKAGEITTPNPELAIQAATQRLYSGLSIPPADLAKIVSETAGTWRDLRAQGISPDFIPSVTPARASSAFYAPSISPDHTPSISTLQARTWDSAGSVRDPIIALKYDAMQQLRSMYSKRFAEEFVVKNHGRTGEALQARYQPAVEAMLRANPLLDTKSALRDLITREWQPYDPVSFTNPSAATIAPSSYTAGEQMWVPKSTARVLSDLASPRATRLGAVFDPVMNVFRSSVLTFSPRWYAGNVVGGGIMAAGMLDSPINLFRNAKTAWAMAKDPEAAIQFLSSGGDTLSLTRSQIADLPPALSHMQAQVEWARGINAHNKGQVAATLQQFEAGKAMRKVADSLSPVSNALDPVRGFLRSAADKGHNFNSLMDNFWQAQGFLDGLDQGLMKGMSKAEAIRAGVEGGRRIFETWDTLTPIERSVVRSVFPFYGFTRNLLKYTLQYPSTHPTRLAILSSLAKAEQADTDSGLPQQIADLLHLGGTSTDGTVKAINVGGLNPFQDVASYASLLGFMAGREGDLSAITKNVNPLLSVTLKEMGVDPSRGKADLYPDLYFDPATGSLSARTGNTLYDLATSIVPQSNVVGDLVGLNTQFKQTLRTNPDAAGRMLLSSLGVPVVTKDVNLSAERMKAEKTRFTQQADDLSQGLKTGDWSAAEAWPDLVPILHVLEKMPPEMLRQYQLNEAPGLRQAVGGAF